MAVVIPVIAAFASGAAAVGAIGAATTTLGLIAGYASLAGAVLTGVGAITGKKDLMKIGGILSLAGGIGTIADSAMNAAAGKAAEEAGKAASMDALRASEQAMAAGGAAGATPLANEALLTAQDAAMKAAAAKEAATATAMEASLTPLAQDAAAASGGAAAAGTAAPPSSIAESVQQASLKNGITQADTLTATSAGDAAGLGGATAPVFGAPGGGGLAKSLTEGMSSVGDTLKKGWDGLKPMGKDLSVFAKDNKELLTLGGNFLDGALGSQARFVKLKERENQQQQSLMDRAYANLNSPTIIQSPLLQRARLKVGGA